MYVIFLIAALIAALATVMVVTRAHAVHALLYLIVSFLAVAVVFYALGAPFIAALEVIIYAGAIMVVFVFVVMMLNLTEAATAQEHRWLQPGIWIGPGLLALVLFGEIVFLLLSAQPTPSNAVHIVDTKQVGSVLLGPYLLGVELASFLLLAGLVGAYHLGRHLDERTTDER